MTSTSVADAKNRLPSLIHQAETGEVVHITRRGKAVAVLLSETEYARLSTRQKPLSFWDQIVDMRSAPDFEPMDLTREEMDSWRDHEPGKDFQWPD